MSLFSTKSTTVQNTYTTTNTDSFNRSYSTSLVLDGVGATNVTVPQPDRTQQVMVLALFALGALLLLRGRKGGL